MRRFFVIVISLIIISIVIFLALPLSMGFWLQKNYQKLLDRVNKSKELTVAVVSFDRGWFSSKATLQITLNSPWLKRQGANALVTQGGPIQFTVQEKVKHGPWMIGNLNGKDRVIWAKALVISDNTDPDLAFHATTLVQFDNTIRGVVNAKNITIEDTQRQLVLNQIQSHFTFVPQQQELVSRTTVGSANVAKKQHTAATPNEYQLTLVLQSLVVDAHLHHAAPLWYGDRSITIDNITYTTAQNQPLTLQHIVLGATQSQTGDATSTTATAHVDNVKSNTVDLNALNIKFSLLGLNTQALVDLAKTAMTLKDVTQVTTQEMTALYQPALALLSKGFTAKLHYLNFDTSDGAIQTSAQVIVPPQPQTMDGTSLLKSLDMELQIHMPTAWLQKQLSILYQGKSSTVPANSPTIGTLAQQQVQTWINDKKLIQEGQSITSHITFKNGQLLINGLPAPYKTPVQESTPTATQPPA